MKKILSFLIITVMTLCLLGSVTFARTAAFATSSASGKLGDTVDIVLSCEENISASGGLITISYNPDDIEFVSFSVGNMFSSFLTSANSSVKGAFKFAFAAALDADISGNVLTVRFRIRTTEKKPSAVSAEISDLTDADGTVFDCTASVGTVNTDTSGLSDKWDINGDGKLDAADTKLLSDILLGKKSGDGVDLNGDGTFDISDIVYLNYYMSAQ